MKAASIVPTKYLEFTAEDPYHMCLAHLIGHDSAYTEFYRNIGRDHEKYLIMDNGVIEGDQRPIEEIVRKALSVNANEIILPDVFLNMEETLERSYEALRYVKDNFPLKIMAVPQGKTVDEWKDCAIAMIDWGIDCIGIPKVLTHIGGKLHSRLNAVMDLGNKLRGLDIHFLGCWSTPLELLYANAMVRQGKCLPIRGCDSAIAYVYTRSMLSIDDSSRPDNNHIDFNDAHVSVSLLAKNLSLWRDCCEPRVYDDDLDEVCDGSVR